MAACGTRTGFFGTTTRSAFSTSLVGVWFLRLSSHTMPPHHFTLWSVANGLLFVGIVLAVLLVIRSLLYAIVHAAIEEDRERR